MVRLLMALILAAFGQAAAAATVDEARAAFRYAYPVYQMITTRTNAVARVEAAGGAVVNNLNHRKGLSDHTNRNVTTPNNDTLYSASWLDLSAGPVVLVVPETGKRYASAALMDLFTDHFALLGTRTTKGMAGRYLIVGPEWRDRAPKGTTLIRSPMNDAWLIVRVLVDGPEDLAAAQKVQAGFSVTPIAPGRRAFAERLGEVSDPERFLAVVSEALGRSPGKSAQEARARAFRKLGIAPGDPRAFAKLDPATQAIWRSNIQRFYDELRGGLQAVGVEKQGWSYPDPGIGNFGRDDLYRARIALGGLGVLPREEAVYLSARTTADGDPLDGRHNYRLVVPGNVPVEAFWSLSLYEIAPDGRLFFVANPIGRYAVGNRSAGMKFQRDGSVELLIQAEPPAEASGNWLPAPKGPFALTFRAYLPREQILDGSFTLPAVEQVASKP